MKLAEEIWITLAKEEVELRPSLYHALQLERRPGSFGQLLKDIQEGSLSAALDIIRPHFDGLFLANRVHEVLPKIQPQLFVYVFGCMGVDPDAPEPKTKAKAVKPRPMSEYLTDLYRIGTGWLDWSPEDTLDATPLEITLAYEGKRQMLRAIYGGATEAAKDDRPLNDKFRSIFQNHGTTKESAE
ncbi:hypothetical protein C8J31_101790 [Rhizobium sp. PP-CC-2G-626]|nr:hypothetical protein C8J31_101790 [Rhizobium sp. PP-CC-2G-626]